MSFTPAVLDFSGSSKEESEEREEKEEQDEDDSVESFESVEAAESSSEAGQKVLVSFSRKLFASAGRSFSELSPSTMSEMKVLVGVPDGPSEKLPE